MEGAPGKPTKTSDNPTEIISEAVRLTKGKRVLARGFWKAKDKRRRNLKVAMKSSKAGYAIDLSSDGSDAGVTVRNGADLPWSSRNVILLSDDSDAEEVVPKAAISVDSALDVIQLSEDSDDADATPAAAATAEGTSATEMVELGASRTFKCVGSSLSLKADGAQ